jgi:hypothetical protein
MAAENAIAAPMEMVRDNVPALARWLARRLAAKGAIIPTGVLNNTIDSCIDEFEEQDARESPGTGGPPEQRAQIRNPPPPAAPEDGAPLTFGSFGAPGAGHEAEGTGAVTLPTDANLTTAARPYCGARAAVRPV